MSEAELQAYLQTHYPKESAACEWKAFCNLTHAVSGRKGEDIASYISAIANMEGGHLVIGVEDATLRVLGIEQFADYTTENIRLRLLGRCTNLDSENFQVEALSSSDAQKTVWVFHIPRHRPRLPVYAHDKAWQRLDDSLVELRDERREAILAESLALIDWSAATVPGAGVAAHVAKITGNEGAYIRNRAFDDAHYKELILAYLKEYGSASRAQLTLLILDKLSLLSG